MVEPGHKNTSGLQHHGGPQPLIVSPVGCHDLQVENVHPIVAVQVGTEVVTPLAGQFLPTGCEDHQVKDIDRAVGIDVAGDVVSEALRRCRGSGLRRSGRLARWPSG